MKRRGFIAWVLGFFGSAAVAERHELRDSLPWNDPQSDPIADIHQFSDEPVATITGVYPDGSIEFVLNRSQWMATIDGPHYFEPGDTIRMPSHDRWMRA